MQLEEHVRSTQGLAPATSHEVCVCASAAGVQPCIHGFWKAVRPKAHADTWDAQKVCSLLQMHVSIDCDNYSLVRSSSESCIDSKFLARSASVCWRSLGGSAFPRNLVRSGSLCLVIQRIQLLFLNASREVFLKWSCRCRTSRIQDDRHILRSRLTNKTRLMT